MSVTIKDIAKIANVSHTTVSRALNDSPLINSETKDRIKAIALEMDYTPNFNAKSLVLDRSYHLGLFFSTINTGTSAGFFYATVRGVNNVIKDRYNLVVRGIDDYADYQGITRKNFDGIIVMSQSIQDDNFIRHLVDKGIPHVVLNRHIEWEKVVNILSDDHQGAFRVVEYLINHGHQDIAIIEGKEGFKSTMERKDGYLQAMQSYHLPIKKEYQVAGNYNLESGYDAMKQLLQLPTLPSAVFCSNDDMAVGAMKAIAEHNLRVPEHISVTGFDDNVFSGYLSPALTTVKRPIEQISKQGATMLLEIIDDRIVTRQISYEPIYIHTELMIRDSVKKIREGKVR